MLDLSESPMRRPAKEPYLLEPALLADPAAGFGKIREQGPVVRGWLTDTQPVWLITRYDDVRAGLRDPRFVNTPDAVDGHTGEDPRQVLVDMLNLPDEVRKYFLVSALDIDPPDHTRLRGVVARAFTARRMQDLRARVERLTAGLLDDLHRCSPDGVLELVDGYAYPLVVTIVCELTGVPEKARPVFRRWGDDILVMEAGRLRESSPAVINTVLGLLDERRREPGDDLLTTLAAARDDDRFRLSDEEAVAMVLNVVMAGYDNTAQLLINSVAALLTHPDQLRLLRDDPGLMPGAVDEFIRWGGPDIMVRMRIAAEDADFRGTRIRKGDCVQFILVSANRDPRRYDAPDRLDITRVPQDGGENHIGFGHGIHYCVGAALSRLQCEIALKTLLARYPDLCLADGPDSLHRTAIPGAAPRLPHLRVRI
ncbi:cytochrome P450 [Streptomyces sp. NBC_01023]|uniref:cytochrome P450 family protein n=1 Tax=Streptomyces sp. NBC_01023 TaxID=2903724 RepID=UPI00386AA376|nr:cytochrome P450 [Streptomyces sp. NBC_01023]